MPFLLGIDIGTYEAKGVLTDVRGRILAQTTRGHTLSLPKPGWAEHDAEGVWWTGFVELTRQLIRQAGVNPAEIAGVACSAIGPCVLPLDETGRPLRPAILYGIDTRAIDEIAELTELLGAEAIIATGGAELSAQSAGPKIRWLQRHEPELWARTRHVVTSTSYLVFRLTGRLVIDHYTATTYSPLYDLHRQQWSAAGLAALCDADRLPTLAWTTAIAGEVTPIAARETGLAAGTPVIVGTADAAAEAVGAGVVTPGDTMLMYGTTLFFIEICAKLPSSSTLWPAVSLVPKSYAVAAGMSTAGALTRWFRDQFAAEARAGEAAGGPNAYAALADEASQIDPGAEGLLVLPYFSGERTPLNDPLARGLVAGLTLAHTRGHLYRALLEGVAFGIRHNLEALAAAGEPAQRLVAIGGGTQNRLWLQIVSDVTGLVQNVRHTPGAAYGDAFLAGVGVGLLPDLAAIHEWLGAVTDQVQPSAARAAHYAVYYQLYRQLYEDSRTVVHQLAKLGQK
jgi:xylulokinase